MRVRHVRSAPASPGAERKGKGERRVGKARRGPRQVQRIADAPPTRFRSPEILTRTPDLWQDSLRRGGTCDVDVTHVA